MTLTWRKKKTVDEFVASQKGLHVTTCNLSKQLLEPLEYNNHYTRERKQKKKKEWLELIHNTVQLSFWHG